MALRAPAPDRITQKICDAIKAQIAAGLLSPGAYLSSTRSMAAEWGISRTTVTAAYEQLIAEGYLETRQGARTQVAQGLGQRPALPNQAHPSIPVRLSDYGHRLADFTAPPVTERDQLLVDFRYGDLAGDDFPMLAWKKAIGSALLRHRGRLRYGDPQGLVALRAALQGYVWRARGLRCAPEQIVVVNGSQQGLDLCARLLINPGDPVVIEDPGYTLARQAFAAVDQNGIQTDSLPSARVAYTTPSHQFPLGGVLSAARRRELLAWAGRVGAYIIEDDYDSEYRFDIAPIPPLQAIDDAGRVIYLGTVSKTLSPTLRLGFLIVPIGLAPSFAKAKRLIDRHTPSLEQHALSELVESGAYERHIRRVRRRNGERRAALLAALSRMIGDAVLVVGADAGLHVVIWLTQVPRAQEAAFIARACAAGIGLYPVTPLYALAQTAPRPNMAGLVMGYASLDEPALLRGVQIIAELLTSYA